MATFDDMALERKVTIYDKGFDQGSRTYGEYITRSGDVEPADLQRGAAADRVPPLRRVRAYGQRRPFGGGVRAARRAGAGGAAALARGGRGPAEAAGCRAGCVKVCVHPSDLAPGLMLGQDVTLGDDSSWAPGWSSTAAPRSATAARSRTARCSASRRAWAARSTAPRRRLAPLESARTPSSARARWCTRARQLGAGAHRGRPAQVRERVTVGAGAVVGRGCGIDNDVTIGPGADPVELLYRGRCGDRAGRFLGPGVVTDERRRDGPPSRPASRCAGRPCAAPRASAAGRCSRPASRSARKLSSRPGGRHPRRARARCRDGRAGARGARGPGVRPAGRRGVGDGRPPAKTRPPRAAHDADGRDRTHDGRRVVAGEVGKLWRRRVVAEDARDGPRGDPEGRKGGARHGRGRAAGLPAGARGRVRDVQPADLVRDLFERRAAHHAGCAARVPLLFNVRIGRRHIHHFVPGILLAVRLRQRRAVRERPEGARVARDPARRRRRADVRRVGAAARPRGRLLVAPGPGRRADHARDGLADGGRHARAAHPAPRRARAGGAPPAATPACAIRSRSDERGAARAVSRPAEAHPHRPRGGRADGAQGSQRRVRARRARRPRRAQRGPGLAPERPHDGRA